MKILALITLLCMMHSTAMSAKADVIIDDHGNGCGRSLSGDQVLAAGEVLAEIAPQLNFRLVIADKVGGQWSPAVRRSIIAALAQGQIPMIITCSRGDGPVFQVRSTGSQIQWHAPYNLARDIGLENVRVLIPSFVRDQDIPF